MPETPRGTTPYAGKRPHSCGNACVTRSLGTASDWPGCRGPVSLTYLKFNGMSSLEKRPSADMMGRARFGRRADAVRGVLLEAVRQLRGVDGRLQVFAVAGEFRSGWLRKLALHSRS